MDQSIAVTLPASSYAKLQFISRRSITLTMRRAGPSTSRTNVTRSKARRFPTFFSFSQTHLLQQEQIPCQYVREVHVQLDLKDLPGSIVAGVEIFELS